MLRHFDEELSELKKNILEMGDLVQSMVSDVVKALTERDTKLLSMIKERENTVNRMQIDIDEYILRLVALRQPTAIDLRLLMGVQKINSELERVGDHAVNISDHIATILKYPPLKPYIDLPKMVDAACAMFRESLRTFVDLDTAGAASILKRDDEVDDLRDKIVDELVDLMTADPTLIRISLHLILLANNLEKIADHATNIAEIVVFVAQGKDIRHPGAQ